MPAISFTNADQIDSLCCDLEGRLEVLADDGNDNSPDYQDMESALSALNALPRNPGKYDIEISGNAFSLLSDTLINTLDMDSDMENVKIYSPLRENIGDEWHAGLSPEILEIDILSNCGADCLSVIYAAQKLLRMLLDISPAEQEAIRAAVKHQCSVFYFG